VHGQFGEGPPSTGQWRGRDGERRQEILVVRILKEGRTSVRSRGHLRLRSNAALESGVRMSVSAVAFPERSLSFLRVGTY
jgi:hypothetical protein